MLPAAVYMPAARRGALHVPLLTFRASWRAQTGGAHELRVRLLILPSEFVYF